MTGVFRNKNIINCGKQLIIIIVTVRSGNSAWWHVIKPATGPDLFYTANFACIPLRLIEYGGQLRDLFFGEVNVLVSRIEQVCTPDIVIFVVTHETRQELAIDAFRVG